MDNIELRSRCIDQAIHTLHGEGSPDAIIAAADKFLNFVEAKTPVQMGAAVSSPRDSSAVA